MSQSNGHAKPKFTPTQQKMLDLLSDGLPHSKDELHKCLWDEQGTVNNIRIHISALRVKIASNNETIVCEYRNRRVHYRHVKLLNSANLS